VEADGDFLTKITRLDFDLSIYGTLQVQILR